MKQQSAQICWEKDKSLDKRGPLISGAIIIASAWSLISDTVSNHSLNGVSAAFLPIKALQHNMYSQSVSCRKLTISAPLSKKPS